MNERSWAIVEQAAVGFGLASVWLERQRSILLYPTGIVSVVIYVVLCYRSGIYADMLLNLFYFVMSIYGWVRWAGKVDSSLHVPVLANSRRQNVFWLTLTGVFWLGCYAGLARFTDSTIPVIDSFTAALSITAMVLLANRRIENWIYWIITDAVSIPMFYRKGLELTALQFGVFTVVAVSGYLNWRGKLATARSAAELTEPVYSKCHRSNGFENGD